ncbi:patatin family protein [Thiohalobacter sp. COW1]|uniref:Esterase n=1 Tax=Thiohalobacter thiocyanaticus TaxID=585455 RepID=A0A1Z4VT53_9GAMM|nr:MULTISPECIES: patatin-like phospholipase RssA [Thiohalobacter]BAZ94508.1 esterase [Thiohalobacter thiocyanaticus]BCO30417.1 patatin family protein [Thiohalobacter sp. COW1]
MSRRRPRIGLALGGGAARGWAHIGVIQYLKDEGIDVDVICGTSIGSIVGGAEAAGQLDTLREWLEQLEWQDIIRYLDVTFTGGLLQGTKLMDFFRERLQDAEIDKLDRPFAAVATELSNGQEVWLQSGSLMDAMRASIALPGLFTPVERDGRWLVDGGLVNPVPVSLCRALGAERIIAVDLNSDILGRRTGKPPRSLPAEEDESAQKAWGKMLRKGDWQGMFQTLFHAPMEQWKSYFQREASAPPSLVDVLAQSVYIMQVRITRARMAGDPPDVLLTPRLSQIRLLEFHRATEAIEEGYKVARRAGDQIKRLLE